MIYRVQIIFHGFFGTELSHTLFDCDLIQELELSEDNVIDLDGNFEVVRFEAHNRAFAFKRVCAHPKQMARLLKVSDLIYIFLQHICSFESRIIMSICRTRLAT